MQMSVIYRRLIELEKKSGAVLPVVFAEYQNSETVTYKGLPPINHIFRSENPIIRTWGSDFADMVNELIHPVPNRCIEDFAMFEKQIAEV